MLIEFRVANFRSIRDRQALTLVAGPGKELDTANTFEPGVAGFERLLRSAVIYGPNAGGKTNLLLALQSMQTLVVNSAIASQQGNPLPYMPFKLAKEARDAPSEFEITFIADGVRYEYGFSVDAVKFHNEWLIAYPHDRPQKLFERSYHTKSASYEWSFSSNLRGSRKLWRDATRGNALFLSTAVQLNSAQLLPVFRWFQQRLVVIASATQFNPTLTLKLLDRPDGKEKVLGLLRAADLGISDVAVRREPLLPGAPVQGIVYVENSGGAAAQMVVKVTSLHQAADRSDQVSFDLAEESHGTQILFQTAGAWLNVLANGEVLLVDELDTSLHPLMTRFLVGLFHDTATNPRNAQLVFTTHDTSLLDSTLFRRDQIWFVEKMRTGATKLFPLSDFSPRKEEALERGYLKGRFGGLPFISELIS